MNNDLEKAAEILKNGGIVIFPTDTAFGIGCRIDNEGAIEKLIKIRGRKENQPFPVLVSSLEMAKKYLKSFSRDVKNLTDKYWPGGLTVVLDCREELVNPVIRGNGKTLGVRMPDHETTLRLIDKVGVPIIGSSANFSKGNTPFSLDEVDRKLLKLVDFVLEGKTKNKDSSTVVDCTGKQWKILRQGVVNVSEKVLIIDTFSNEYILVGLEIAGKKFLKKQKINFRKAQAVLPLIEELLKENKLALKDITEITVNTGPGSFTGLRVGVSIANAISHFLKIPVNNKKIGDFAEPIYK
jgi:L-threonylcarbamoyladenylate synthase